MVVPEQTGLLLLVLGTPGNELMVTVVVAAGPVQPFTVAVTEYKPPFIKLTLGIEGFCIEELNPLGPVQV